MRKRLSLVAASLCLAAAANAQNLTVSNFEGLVVPQYMGSGTSTRTPFVFRARVTGLSASTTYRYFTNMAQAADIGTANPGAGNPMLISADGLTFTYTTGASITTAGGYETFTTDASGNRTAFFAVVNTGNARFTAGNTLRPTIVIGDTSGVTLQRLALDTTVTVLQFSASAGATNGTGIYGASNATAKNYVFLYDNTAGTSRPLTGSWAESIGTTFASAPAYWSTNVQGSAGAWGGILPNTLATGVQRIEVRDKSTGSVYFASTDADGSWTSGANTVNPAGGTTAIAIASGDAALPVELDGFDVQ